MILQTSQIKEISEFLASGQIGVLPTDTIYGIHCKTLDHDLIKRIYQIKNRPEGMPFITLISEINELKLFDVIIGDFEREQINKFWPGPNTLILKTLSGETRSFRIPRNDFLQSILKTTGSLISTSANLHLKPSAKNINEAIEYFGDKIDFYVDGGELNNPPSSVYDISEGKVNKLR
mgnify:FL=1